MSQLKPKFNVSEKINVLIKEGKNPQRFASIFLKILLQNFLRLRIDRSLEKAYSRAIESKVKKKKIKR